MLKRLKSWDGLGLRLFLLMWVTLVISHLVAFSVVSPARTSWLGRLPTQGASALPPLSDTLRSQFADLFANPYVVIHPAAGTPLRVAVNFSAHQFSQPDLAEQVRAILQRTAAPVATGNSCGRCSGTRYNRPSTFTNRLPPEGSQFGAAINCSLCSTTRTVAVAKS